MPTTTMRVGVIGLGHMGSALADALMARGFGLIVWNRSEGRTKRFADAGIKVAASVAQAAAEADILVVCLFNQDAVREVLLTSEVAAAMRGKPLVQLTTLGERGLDELEAWTAAQQVPFLKGDILDYPDGIRRGEAIVLYGGEKQTFATVRPVLDALGGHAVHAAKRIRDAQRTMGAYYCFLYPALIAFLHGAALCHRVGVSPAAFAQDMILPLLKGPTLARMIEGLAQASTARSYGGEIQATLDAWNDGLSQLVDSTKARARHAGLLPVVKELLDQTAARGYGQQDLAAVFEMLIDDGQEARE